MFVTMDEARYRALDPDALEARRNEILALAEGESDVDEAVLEAESRMCAAEFERRNRYNGLRQARMAQAAASPNVVGRMSYAPAPAEPEDPFDTPEYRNAFMELFCRGTAMPEQFRTGVYAQRTPASTLTTDVPVMIPTTLSNKIIEQLDEYGDIWARVSKTNVKGGVDYSVLELKPVAAWVGEESTQDWQKLEAKVKVSFSYYELECRISQSMLASVTTFNEFQRRFVPLAVRAIIEKVEEGIIKGTGSSQMLGITADERVTNTVSMSASDVIDWKKWYQKVKAKIPRQYRNGEFIMAQSTWDSIIETLADDQNAPISLRNAVNNNEVYRFMGFDVLTVPDDVLPDFATASANEVFCIYGRLSDYCVNSNQQLMTVQYDDWDVRKRRTVAYMVLDGKVLDPYGFMLVKKSS